MRKVALIVVVMLLAIAVVPAAARGKPQDVTIVSVETFDPPGGVFNASGSAVEAGLICASGETEVKFWAWHRFFRTASSIKKFTCDDDGGIFYVKLEIKFTDTGTWANWVVVDWAEDPNPLDLEELKGQGRLIGVRDDPPGGITDTYTGQLH